MTFFSSRWFGLVVRPTKKLPRESRIPTARPRQSHRTSRKTSSRCLHACSFQSLSNLIVPTELSVATGEFAQHLNDLASSDVGKQLSQSLAALAEVQRKAQDLQAVQADQDMATLMATADEYSRLIHSVRVGL